jgi:protein arginine N-methyltransferase 1
MYSLHEYGRMIGDVERVGAYAEALRRTIRPGAVVVDIGTGPGIWALLACRFGARRVYAMDPSRAIQVGRELAIANGYADRIEFIERESTKVTLPERADVIVEDVRGVLPAHYRALEALIDARRRFLTPGGAFIPQTETLWAAPVCSERLYDLYRSPLGPERLGLKLDRLEQAARNLLSKRRIGADEISLPPKRWATIDYLELESPDLAGTAEWSVEREGTIHGFAVWFDSQLAPGISMSNAPNRPQLIYGQGLLPLTHPLTLEPDDMLRVTLRAKLMGSGYTWCWDTEIFNQHTSRARVSTRQSNFSAASLPDRLMRRTDPAAVPGLNDDGRRLAAMLSLLDEHDVLLEALAETAVVRFPDLFQSRDLSSAYVDWVRRTYAREA